jgi:hypothetical protein
MSEQTPSSSSSKDAIEQTSSPSSSSTSSSKDAKVIPLSSLKDDLTFHEQYQIKWEDMNKLKFFGYTALLTSVVDFCVYPLDVLRTRLQVQVIV